MKKPEAVFIEGLVRALPEPDYWAFVPWLASGCNGSLWGYMRPARLQTMTREDVQHRTTH
jgi:hypothetical protein